MKTKEIIFTTNYSVNEVATILEEYLPQKPIKCRDISPIQNTFKISQSLSEDSDIQILATGRDFWGGEWAVQIYVDTLIEWGCEVRLVSLGNDFITKFATGIADRENLGNLIHLSTSLKKAEQIRTLIQND